jgi:hypothetical protein
MENEKGQSGTSGQKQETGNPGAPASGTPLVRAGLVRFSAAQFLICLAAFIVSAPFVEAIPNYGTFIDGSLLTLVLMSGVLAVARKRRILIVAIVLVIPVIAARWAHLFRPGQSPAITLVPALVFFGFMIGHLLYFILQAKRVDSEVLCAGLSVYLLLGMTWMVAYMLVDQLSPGAFVFTAGGPNSAHDMTGFTAIYFSFITLTTVGYGDIVPISNIARMLTSIEAVTGTLFMAVMIARLVSLYSTQGPGDSEQK